MKWWPRLRPHTDASSPDVASAYPQFEKFGENLTPNLRAIRFAMTTSELLLAMGVSANSVVAMALDITETYCTRRVHVDISSNLIMFSQLRGIDKEPLTLIRSVVARDTNNMTIQALQRLIRHIKEGRLTLDHAEIELDAIIKKPSTYPWWVVMIANASVAAGVAIMFTRDWRAILTTFLIGIVIDRVLALLIKRAIPTFFRQIAAAASATILAALVAFLGNQGVDFFSGMNPTLIVVGGIIMLVAGLTIVSAIQDAIDEYYLTATARILKVAMLTVGIVIGILIGLYSARKLGYGIAVSPDPLLAGTLNMQLLGAAVLAVAYAIFTHTHFRAVLWAGLIAAGGLAISFNVREYEIAAIPASGVAAIFVGLVASLLSRWWRTPSAGMIAAGILPLVPGLALYNGLMQLINYPPGDPFFFRGLGTLFNAVAIALAIAAGASFGSLIGQPLHKQLTMRRNMLPFPHLFRHSQRVKTPANSPEPTSV
ncbi:threonine/serine exporter family protein [Candidatus Saccharibacteria bacterium]|nr:threonine/serine exporter family protein [Candidatus Saccharibacteria bacterium]